MKQRLLFLLSFFLILSLGFFACQSGPDTQTYTFPTPIVLDQVLDSAQISATSDTLCPDEEEYRSRPADFYEKGWELNLAHPPTDSGWGSNMTNISDGINIGWNTYEVPEQQIITLTYRYVYRGAGPGDSTPILFRFLFLIDEQLTETTFNGTPLPYYDLILHPGEDGAILVDVPPLPPGIHEVILVGIANVDREPQGTEFTDRIYNRLTLVSGGENFILPRPYTKLKAAGRFWIRFPNDSGFSIVLSLDAKQLLVWNYPDTILSLPLATPVDFYMYAGYEVTSTEGYENEPLARKQPFALVMLVDYQQVPISTDAPIIYGIVTPSTKYARIPVHLLPPQTPGLHQIVALRINYPGFPICLISDTERTYPYPLILNRVGIKIEP